MSKDKVPKNAETRKNAGRAYKAGKVLRKREWQENATRNTDRFAESRR